MKIKGQAMMPGKKKEIRRVDAVAQWRLCNGCGACMSMCGNNAIELVDVENSGIRPKIDSRECSGCGECVEVCPGYEVSHGDFQPVATSRERKSKSWGPILEIWEGYASDPDIRYEGSSGGTASAIAVHCIENENVQGIIHTGVSGKSPYRNQTVISRSREEILSNSGSRYSPASPCDGLTKLDNGDTKIGFIGKPCDISGLKKIMAKKGDIEEKMFVSIGIFCAGTPSTAGTRELIRRCGIAEREVAGMRYRGKGWPGSTEIQVQGKSPTKLSYMEAWGFLQKYRPFRCYLCPDGTGELADISCGDAWHRERSEDEKGHSLVVVRSERGRQVLENARKARRVTMERVDVSTLARAQKNLLAKREQIWGRIKVMGLCGIPFPRYNGFDLFDDWARASLRIKAKSLLGTLRRIMLRKYYLPAGQ